MGIHLLEGATESMPQVILQTAFLIRSANSSLGEDDNSETLLLLLSLIASVVSVANKYRWLDELDEYCGLKPKYKGYKLKFKFPGCINWWYLVTAIWRYSHIITRFTVFSLIWGVCGGGWVGVYTMWSLMLTMCAYCLIMRERNLVSQEYVSYFILGPIGNLPGIHIHIVIFFDIFYLDIGITVKLGSMSAGISFSVRWFSNLSGYALIAVFASVKFSCDICVDEELRQFGANETIDRLFVIGCCTWLLDVVLFFVLRRSGIYNMEY